MEKERAQIKIVDTEDGFRIEVSGKNLKGVCCCSCNCDCDDTGSDGKSDCCAGDDKK